jgi:hypothetical protein
MTKRAIAIALIITIIVSTLMVFNGSMSAASTADPAILKITIGPSSVPADKGTYNCVYVQLQDASGKPARALQDTVITLSSSVTSIGTVDDKITIPKDATFASANFFLAY